MSRFIRWPLIVAIAVLVLVRPCLAQAPSDDSSSTKPATTQTIALRLTNGSVLYGTVQAESADEVTVLTVSGATVTVPRARIASLRPATGKVVRGEFIAADPNATRLFFAPTARSLPRGHGYVADYQFLMPSVQVGITDRFSVGAGTPLLFLDGVSKNPLWFTPKLQLTRGARTSTAVGVMHLTAFGDASSLGFAYAVATSGDTDNAVTAGVGWAYARYHDTHAYPCSASSTIPSVRKTSNDHQP